MPRSGTSEVPQLSALTAGFVTVLVGIASSAAIVYQAARAAGADTAETGSWLLASGIAMGTTCIGFALRYRAPVVTAWSTPGAALLVGALPGVPLSAAVGAFVVSGALITVSGLTGWFERVMDKVPVPIASALLGGVLLQFGLKLFGELQDAPAVVLPMLAVYLVCRRWLPRYAIVSALLAGIASCAAQGRLDFPGGGLALAVPHFVMPTFAWQTLVGVGLPLFVVTMASQNIPGVAAVRAFGYDDVPISPVITWTGLASLLLAPLGCFGINLAAITAAICMGPESHPDPRRRYVSVIYAGVFYLAVGLLGTSIVVLIAGLPEALVLGIAGLGIMNTIGSSLTSALSDPGTREPALVTFLVTGSGMTLLGIGSAFWGVVFGVATLLLLRTTRLRPRLRPWRRRPEEPELESVGSLR